MTPIPINLEDLLRQRTVEGARVEYKAGWNPDPTMRTVCAFANDFENLGGGYIVIGQDCDADGQPVFPPQGVPNKDIDRIQRELLQYCQLLQPPYFPVVSVEGFQQKTLIVIWAAGGQNRPYKVPKEVTAKKKEHRYYIRRYSSTVEAKGEDEQELISLAASVPFDDRPRQDAPVDALSRRLIHEFLDEVRSDLAKSAGDMPLEALGRQMGIVDGPSERPMPKNVGLMFFNDDPARFFPATQIDVVFFPDGAGGDRFEEKVFKGPLARMTRDALSYIERSYLHETVIKHPDRAEAERFWNFPYAAIEEAVVNAVYHRSYDIREPIEVRIEPDGVVVLSYPGPDRSIRMEDLRVGQARPRRYRNRRIGEFLKELELSEGRATGIPKILRKMRDNGSPPPEFDTDDDRTYFMIRLPIHEKAAAGGEPEQHDGIKDGKEPETPGMTEKTPEKTLAASEKMTEKTGRVTGKTPGKTPEETLGKTLGKTPRQILKHMIETPTITTAELAALLGKSESATERAIRKLRQAGVLKRIGSRKVGYWQVAEQDK